MLAQRVAVMSATSSRRPRKIAGEKKARTFSKKLTLADVGSNGDESLEVSASELFDGAIKRLPTLSSIAESRVVYLSCEVCGPASEFPLSICLTTWSPDGFDAAARIKVAHVVAVAANVVFGTTPSVGDAFAKLMNETLNDAQRRSLVEAFLFNPNTMKITDFPEGVVPHSTRPPYAQILLTRISATDGARMLNEESDPTERSKKGLNAVVAALVGMMSAYLWTFCGNKELASKDPYTARGAVVFRPARGRKV